MNCPTEDVLLDYAAGRLPAAQAALLEKHAESCAHCAALRMAQSAVWLQLDEWKPAPVSEGFNRELWRKIDADSDGSRALTFGFGMWKRFAPLVFAAGVLVTAFVLDHSGRQSEEPKQASQAPLVVTASEADQLERTLDDIQMLREADSEPAAARPLASGKRTL